MQLAEYNYDRLKRHRDRLEYYRPNNQQYRTVNK